MNLLSRLFRLPPRTEGGDPAPVALWPVPERDQARLERAGIHRRWIA